MPMYEYRCLKCDKVFDVVQSVAEREEARPRCPGCKAEDVQTVLTPFFAKTSKKS